MKTIALEDMMIECILTFCENAAELGCPRDKEVDMWFRELSHKDARKVTEKMLEIIERPPIGEVMKTDKDEVRQFEMVEMELDLEESTIDCLVKYAVEGIKSDKQALLNWAVNDVLTRIINNEDEFVKIAKVAKIAKKATKAKKAQAKKEKESGTKKTKKTKR